MNSKKVVAIVLTAVMLLSLAGCIKKQSAPVDGDALFQVLQQQVAFETELDDKGEKSAAYFSGVPEGAQVRLLVGSAYYSDCLVMLKTARESDLAAATKCIQDYLGQMHDHFISYQPDQVGKLENALLWSQDVWAIACVTADMAKAQEILNNAAVYTENVVVTQGTILVEETTAALETTAAVDADTTAPEETTQAPTVPETTAPPEPTVPALISQSGTYYKYSSGAYRVDDRAFENYFYDEGAAVEYAAVLNAAAEQLAGSANVYALVIPTAIGIVFPDDVRAVFEEYEAQDERIRQIYGKITDSINKVWCFDNLMLHRNEELYFKTDYHWNGPAAYYAYESWCQAKGITPYTLEQRVHWAFEGFQGFLYMNSSGKDPLLGTDTLHAYLPYSQNVDMVFTDREGNQVSWEVVADVTGWAASSKYNAFGGGDNPITVYTNPDVTDGSVGLVIKESFGNALMPYMVDHYSVLYEIDYRYWEGSIPQFVLEHGVQDVTFANNIGMVRSSALVAMLANNFYEKVAGCAFGTARFRVPKKPKPSKLDFPFGKKYPFLF